ncbi:hypothetical protein SAMN02745244_00928 [Tessaracoccus bendigoensis DSM 12906]|uniref:Uncharacterized protein n=1 Tax=Tessaracoccus bendigoensis DSM 12906 TaxID=1123357 RepID=A0A1M6DIS4_9ACTN|nr:hypothetical protein [Tessaracoccus bendigoensis]SHI73041.1 hypothetical protein SAMN02745244_00928 [Tessaracoccus bendigoensis DSM 12906]
MATTDDTHPRDHLLSLAEQQAADATARLQDAGRLIDELRRDAVELATRLDRVRTDNEALQAEVEALRAERDAVKADLASATAASESLEAKVSEMADRLQRDPLRRVARAIRRK